MPDQMTLEQFGQKVKAKYPQYASFSDTEIADKVLAKYPQYKSSIVSSILPEPRTVGNYLSEAARGVGRGLRNDVTGIVSAYSHPLQTAESISHQTQAAKNAAVKEFQDTSAAPLYERTAAAALTGLENAPIIGGMVQRAEEGGTRMASPESLGAATEAITTFAAPDVVGRSIPKVAEILKVKASNLGSAPREVGELAGKTKEVNEAAVANANKANAKVAQEHLEKTQEALHRTEGAELQHREHVSQAEEAAKAENKLNLKKHLQTREDAIRERREAEQKLILEKVAQGKIGPTRAKLQSAWSNLRAATETAREKALKIGNEKYSAVNTALNPLEADMDALENGHFDPDTEERTGGLNKSEEKIKGSDSQPPILTNFAKRIQRGDVMTYKDLQGYYSELGKELSKGTLPGDWFAAYDSLHETVGEQMQRLANSKGMGKALTNSRNYWRRMKQTFGKELNENDAATKAVNKSASDLASVEEQANRIRLLGSFDPDIPKLFNHISNIEKGVESLPKPASEREVVQASKAPVIPPRKPILPKVEPKPIAPPERVAPPNRPTEVKPELKTINSSDIEAVKQKRVERAANHIRHWGTYLGFVWPAIEVVRTVTRGEVPDIGSTAASMIATPLAADAVARIIESPKMKWLLTRATPKDIAQVPADLRGDLPTIAQAAQKQGINVSPAIIAATTGAAVVGQGRKRVAAALQP